VVFYKRAIFACLFLLTSLSLAACGGGQPVETAATISPLPPTPTPVPTPSAADLRGFIYPIAGGCLPKGDQLMPNAPRPYRKGTHEGVDFYDADNCTKIARGTPVVAAKDGVVVRADLSYTDLTREQLKILDEQPDSPEALDLYRGRQVWVDHGNGVTTRYAHLSAIAPGIVKGTPVKAGQLIANVGESGTPESVTAPGSEYHLHFELRTNDSFLGSGLPPSEVRQLYRTLFTMGGQP
jgi:murein DD-endopeptidase MepM/ murein hydrolase activator NlpD